MAEEEEAESLAVVVRKLLQIVENEEEENENEKWRLVVRVQMRLLRRRKSGETAGPKPNAQWQHAPQCRSCRKKFTHFSRGHHCRGCGNSFCQNCSSSKYALPPSFDFGGRCVRVCDGCLDWFHQYLDDYFTVAFYSNKQNKPADVAKIPPNIFSSSRKSSRLNFTTLDTGTSHPHSEDEGEEVDDEDDYDGEEDRPIENELERKEKEEENNKLLMRLSSDAALAVAACGSSGTDLYEEYEDEEDDDEEEKRAGHRAQSVDAVEWRDRSSRPKSNSVFESQVLLKNKQQKQRNDKETSPPPPILNNHSLPLSIPVIGRAVSVDVAELGSKEEEKVDQPQLQNHVDIDEVLTKVAERKSLPISSTSIDQGGKKRLRDRFASSSIIDVSSSDSTSKQSTAGNNNKVFGSFTAGEKHRYPVSFSTDSSSLFNDFNGSVLKFSVTKLSSKRSFFFSSNSKNAGFRDRYILELFRLKGIVKMRSVFRQRMTSFPCNAIQDLRLDNDKNSTLLEIVSTAFTSEETNTSSLDLNEEDNVAMLLDFANIKEKQQFVHEIKQWQRLENHQETVLEELKKTTISTTVRKSSESHLNKDFTVEMGSRSLDSMRTHPKLLDDKSNLNCKKLEVSLMKGEKEVQGMAWPAQLVLHNTMDNSQKNLWGAIQGIVAVTNFRLLFLPFERGHVPFRRTSIGQVAYIPLFAIWAAQRVFRRGNSTSNCLKLICKDFRTMRIEMDGTDSVADERAHALCLLIDALALASQQCMDKVTDKNDKTRTNKQPTESQSNNSNVPFAFLYDLPVKDRDYNGWYVYNIQRDFERQNIVFESLNPDDSPKPLWKLFSNKHGEICPSYPRKLLLPSSFTMSKIHAVAQFRAKGRLPVVTWVHKQHHCVLARSGQPLLGSILSGTSSKVDQELMDLYRCLPDYVKMSRNDPNLTLSHIRSQTSRPIYIFDARKLKASTGNRLLGKGGVETVQDYSYAIIHHLNISNMYKMQASYYALMKLILPNQSQFTTGQDKTWAASVEATRWLEHLQLILEGSSKIARVLEIEGSSCLVHCSDGWDRTCQLTSLAQLMIDPYYRTLRGFAVLVEKEWCQFGHKFAERLGGDRVKYPTGAKMSPIMLQFLDAVWQITHQFPMAFEFNEAFLLFIANSLSSGLFGTFLYDTRLQREAHEVPTQTVSIWTQVLLHPDRYRNLKYKHTFRPLWPWTSFPMLRLWTSYFLQWHPKNPDCRWISSIANLGPHVNDFINESEFALKKEKESLHNREDNDVNDDYDGTHIHTIDIESVPMPIPSAKQRKTSSSFFNTKRKSIY